MTQRIRELEEAETKARDRGHFGKVSMISSCIEGYKLCLEDVEPVLAICADLIVEGIPDHRIGFMVRQVLRDALAEFKGE